MKLSNYILLLFALATIYSCKSKQGLSVEDQGEVLIELIILPNGVIGQLKDVSSEEIAQSLINESIRVILSAGHWVPAKVNGQPVASIKQVRTVFRLK